MSSVALLGRSSCAVESSRWLRLSWPTNGRSSLQFNWSCRECGRNGFVRHSATLLGHCCSMTEAGEHQLPTHPADNSKSVLLGGLCCGPYLPLAAVPAYLFCELHCCLFVIFRVLFCFSSLLPTLFFMSEENRELKSEDIESPATDNADSDTTDSVDSRCSLDSSAMPGRGSKKSRGEATSNATPPTYQRGEGLELWSVTAQIGTLRKSHGLQVSAICRPRSAFPRCFPSRHRSPIAF